MAQRDDSVGWLSDRVGLTLLAVASAALAVLLILPYLQYVLLGVVLAYILVPVQRRLEAYVPPGAAALTLVVVAIIAILLPIVYLLAVALEQALQAVAAINDGALDLEAIERQLEEFGYTVDVADLYETYEAEIESAVQGLALGAIAVVSGLPGILIGLTVTLFVLFGLLRDRERLLAWFRRVLPVRDELQDEMFAELDQLMWASVVGNVAVAAIQALMLGFGLAILGVPSVAFLTVTTFVFALLPLIGAFGVWVPVSMYLFAIGRAVPALLLVGYGSLVSVSDMYLRPALIGRTSTFNAAIIVVGIFGGLVVFGAVGLFIGPVVLGGAKITLDVFARERDAALAERDESATGGRHDGSGGSDGGPGGGDGGPDGGGSGPDGGGDGPDGDQVEFPREEAELDAPDEDGSPDYPAPDLDTRSAGPGSTTDPE